MIQKPDGAYVECMKGENAETCIDHSQYRLGQLSKETGLSHMWCATYINAIIKMVAYLMGMQPFCFGWMIIENTLTG